MARSTPKPSHADLNSWQNYTEAITPLIPLAQTFTAPVLDTVLLPQPTVIKHQSLELNEDLTKRFFNGQTQMSHNFSETSLNSFRRNGVSAQVLRQLRRMPIQNEIDLHGLTRDQALGDLAQFLSTAYERNQHCLQVIHGKGLHSSEGTAILKPLVRQWLAAHPQVRAFVETQDTGAVRVLLFKN